MLYTVNIKYSKYGDLIDFGNINDPLIKTLHQEDLVNSFERMKKYQRKNFEIFKSLVDEEVFYICSTLSDKWLESQLVEVIKSDIADILDVNMISYYTVMEHKKDLIDDI